MENIHAGEESMEKPCVIPWENQDLAQTQSLIVPGVSPYTLPQDAEFLDNLLTWVSVTVLASWCAG